MEIGIGKEVYWIHQLEPSSTFLPGHTKDIIEQLNPMALKQRDKKFKPEKNGVWGKPETCEIIDDLGLVSHIRWHFPVIKTSFR